MIENNCRICRKEVQGNYKLCITCLRGLQKSIMEYFNIQEKEPCDIFAELYSDFRESFKVISKSCMNVLRMNFGMFVIY